MFYLGCLILKNNGVFLLLFLRLEYQILDLLLKEKNIISKVAPYGLKVLGNGKLDKKLTVKASKFSETAIQKITKVGGQAEVL